MKYSPPVCLALFCRGFVNDGVPRGWFHVHAGSTARGFSARLRRLRRRPQRPQNSAHCPPDLARGGGSTRRFPRIALGIDGGACQAQLIAGRGHNIGPTLKLFRRAQARGRPEQILFFKAKALFLTVATAVGGPDFVQRQELGPDPHEPTHARVTFLARGPMTHDPNDGHGLLATGQGPSSPKSQLISTPFLLKSGWAIQPLVEDMRLWGRAHMERLTSQTHVPMSDS